MDKTQAIEIIGVIKDRPPLQKLETPAIRAAHIKLDPKDRRLIDQAAIDLQARCAGHGLGGSLTLEVLAKLGIFFRSKDVDPVALSGELTRREQSWR